MTVPLVTELRKEVTDLIARVRAQSGSLTTSVVRATGGARSTTAEDTRDTT